MSALLDIMQRGGIVMWPILLASIVAIGVIFERIIFFHRNAAPMDAFLNGIANLLRRRKYTEAIERCDEAYGPAVRVVQAAILKRDLPKGELREIVQEVAQMQVPRLEANIPILATVGYIAPLLGLLGTVTGMIAMFMTIDKANGSVPVGQLSHGIWEALLTTAAGLVVAIPCSVAHNYLVSRVNAIITDMERSGIEIIQVLSEPPVVDEESETKGAKEEPKKDAEKKEPAKAADVSTKGKDQATVAKDKPSKP